MLKKTIQYQNYAEPPETIVEDFYFNLTELEALEIELEYGDLRETLVELTRTQDAKKAYGIFKEILLSAYGRKSPNNRGFDKIDENGVPYSRYLAASPALGVFIFELLKDPKGAGGVLREMLPPGFAQEMTDDELAKLVAEANERQQNPETAIKPGLEAAVEAGVAPPEALETPVEAPDKDLREYTHEELVNMPKAQFDRVAGTDPTKWTKPTMFAAFERKGRD